MDKVGHGRKISRYGSIEKALKEIKSIKTTFSINDVSAVTRRFAPKTIASILPFTDGIIRIGKNQYEFDGKEIHVQGDY